MKKISLHFFCFILIQSLIISCVSCSKKIQKNNTTDKENTTQVKPDKDELTREYLKEGFISRDTFRVVIVSTDEECSEGVDKIEQKAKKRARFTLRRYLASKNISMGQNVNAGILNLINSHGKFSKAGSECKKKNTFYFEIKKENIKKHLKRISQQNR